MILKHDGIAPVQEQNEELMEIENIDKLEDDEGDEVSDSTLYLRWAQDIQREEGL